MEDRRLPRVEVMGTGGDEAVTAVRARLAWEIRRLPIVSATGLELQASPKKFSLANEDLDFLGIFQVVDEPSSNSDWTDATTETTASSEESDSDKMSDNEIAAAQAARIEAWAQIKSIIDAHPGILNDARSGKEALGSAIEGGPKGPICGNPHCCEFGHVLSFCPVPVDMEHGDMTGCFFCNVIDHEADACVMMRGVTAASLVNYLIAGRAGLPPWNTRLDWVALAIDNWDLVDFTSLPLTREFVKKWYIPQKAWTNAPLWTDHRSPITDPALAGADRAKLKAMANPKNPCSSARHRPLNEASPDACYCPDRIGNLPLKKNKYIQKYIPARNHLHDHLHPDHDGLSIHTHGVFGPGFAAATPSAAAAAAAASSGLIKQQPKNVAGKVKLGRRAAKKAAAAAAAAAAAVSGGGGGDGPVTAGAAGESVAGPSTAPSPPLPSQAEDQGHAAIVGGVDSDDDDTPLSERMLELADKFDAWVAELRKTVEE